MASSRMKNEKNNVTSLRPSMFLNEFDISALLQSTSVKAQPTEEQNIKPKRFGVHRRAFGIGENSSTISLPDIAEFQPHLQKESSSIEKYHSKKDVVIAAEATSPSQNIHLPTIITSPKPQEKINHTRRYTNDLSDKKVAFRPSILVIDFINQIVKKDKIDGSVKPLTKRRQTKFFKKQ